MKPDAYMPVYWGEFWMAVNGQPDFIIVSYMRALSHYWHHNHCKGLRNDDEFLRKLCQSERDNWPESKSFIFDNEKCFTLDADGVWQQGRAQKEWQKSVIALEKATNRGKMGAIARWKK